MESTFRWERAVTPLHTVGHEGSITGTVGATGAARELLEELGVGEKRQFEGYGGKIYDIERLS